MRRLFRRVAALARPAAANDTASATWTMHGCRAEIGDHRQDLYRAGVCSGRVSGAVFYAENVCIPRAVTLGQVVRVVVRWIDARPGRQHENILLLADEAIRAAWPCRGSRS